MEKEVYSHWRCYGGEYYEQDAEMKEIIEYCGLSGDPEHIQKEDFIEVLNFVADMGY